MSNSGIIALHFGAAVFNFIMLALQPEVNYVNLVCGCISLGVGIGLLITSIK